MYCLHLYSFLYGNYGNLLNNTVLTNTAGPLGTTIEQIVRGGARIKFAYKSQLEVAELQ